MSYYLKRKKMHKKLSKINNISAEYISRFDRDPVSKVISTLKGIGFVLSHHMKFRLSLTNDEGEPVLLITAKLSSGKKIAYIKGSYLTITNGEKRFSDIDVASSVEFDKIEEEMEKIFDGIINQYRRELNV